MDSWKNTALTTLKISISAGIITWLSLKAWNQDQFSAISISGNNWLWLVAAVVMCLSAHLISFFRWRLLVNALEIPFSNWDAMRIGLIGVFFGSIGIGVVGGDTLRVFYAARQATNKLAAIICSVFVDRLIGLLTVFSFAAVGFLIVDLDTPSAIHPDKAQNIRLLAQIIFLVTILGWTAIILFLLVPRLMSLTVLKALMQMKWLKGPLHKFIDSVLLYRRRLGTLLACVGCSAVVNFCFVGMIYGIAKGIDVVHPPLIQHFLLAPFSMAANALPLPGGIGGMELVLSYFYDAVSTATSRTEYGVIVAFGTRCLLLLVAAIGGIAWISNRRQIRTALPAAFESTDEPV